VTLLERVPDDRVQLPLPIGTVDLFTTTVNPSRVRPIVSAAACR